MSRIRLSEKHGVNPSVMKCFVCGADAGVAFFGKLPLDEEAPRFSTRPDFRCTACEQQQKTHTALIEARDGEHETRTGRLFWLRHERMVDLFGAENALNATHYGFAFIDVEVGDMLAGSATAQVPS